MGVSDALAVRCRQTNVSIECLRHNDKPAYVSEGFGGKSLENWPVVGFFRDYVSGEPDRAVKDFATWYAEQFERYANVPSRLGGMRGGSLYRLARDLHATEGVLFDIAARQVDPDLLRRAIRARVDQRFRFLEDFMRQGFRSDLNKDPIVGVRKCGAVVLQGGHHRVAALLARGEGTVPELFVVPLLPARFMKAAIGHSYRRGSGVPNHEAR